MTGARRAGRHTRSERSTDALIGAAAELAAEGGLAAMTFAAIGDRAGYSRGLVTARFGSKAGLVDAMIRRAWQRLRIFEALDEHRGQPGLVQVLGLLDALSDQAERDPVNVRALTVLLLEAAVGTDEALHQRVLEFHRAMVDELAEVIARGIADTSIRADRDPQEEAVHVVAALLGRSYLWVLGLESFAGEQLSEVVRDRLEPEGPTTRGR